MSPVEYYLDKLEMLSKLQPGETISTTTFTISYTDYWSTSIWRIITRENRSETVEYLKNFLTEAIEKYPTQEIVDKIPAALDGINKLKLTYCDDSEIGEKITNLIWDVTHLKRNVTLPVDDFKMTFADAISNHNGESDDEPSYEDEKITIYQFLRESTNNFLALGD